MLHHELLQDITISHAKAYGSCCQLFKQKAVYFMPLLWTAGYGKVLTETQS